jgi:maltose alpha-D-glucosyltransferase/alpha-amylase
MLTLPGTPIIYYGDEFGKLNDEAYYREKIVEIGKDDTRFLVRGKIDWQQLEKDLQNKDSFSSQVFNTISQLVKTRKQYAAFGRGSIKWLEVTDKNGLANDYIMAYLREWEAEKLLILHNLSDKPQTFHLDLKDEMGQVDLFGKKIIFDKESGEMRMKPFDYLWIKL